MLDLALKFIADEVNGYLLQRTASDFGKLLPGYLVDDQGRWSIAEDHLGLTLVNVEEERTLREQAPRGVLLEGQLASPAPELKLNLVLMFTARFQKYDHALRYLSHVLTFFQAQPLFTRATHPGLDARIPRLSMELLAYGPEQLNQMWAYLGGKYLPSAIYRLRLVALRDEAPGDIAPPVTEIGLALQER